MACPDSVGDPTNRAWIEFAAGQGLLDWAAEPIGGDGFARGEIICKHNTLNWDIVARPDLPDNSHKGSAVRHGSS
jgi:hypothetical protein